uniref:UDP-glucuronosyltransferase n=1 Tax=Cyprinus carpio TaxID=7962 RepID=A0A8C1ZYA4_CYPCA
MRLIICVVYLAVFGPAQCGNILVWPTRGSHWINLKIILETVIDKGHNVTVLVPNPSPFMDTKESDRFSYQYFSVSMTTQDMQDFLNELVHFSVYETDQLNLLQIQIKFYELASKHQDMALLYCDGILQSPELCLRVFEPALPFSLLMCGQLPAPPSVVPGDMSKLMDKMNFTDCQAFLFPGRPTSYCEMMGKADIWLIRNYWDFEFPRPFLSNFKYVGGLHCTPAKPLPKDMEEFVQSTGDDGIVVFTLGSMIDKMPKETSNMIASALAQIPQKVKADTLGENTKTYKWIPQNDLLGHPKTRAFVTHGGINGIHEAIYHGVPMVGIPLFGDQTDNLAHMKAKGAAVVMDNIKTTQPQDLVDGLNAIINNPSYKENAMRLSRIHHDRPVKPLDEAVFWIEFVMRNKGAKHLRVEAHNLTWYQYHCLDVFAFLITILTVVLYVFFIMCKFFIMRCCFRSKRKSKKE